MIDKSIERNRYNNRANKVLSTSAIVWISNRVDDAFNIKKSAYKFVMMAVKE